jgi:hypothetical protein
VLAMEMHALQIAETCVQAELEGVMSGQGCVDERPVDMPPQDPGFNLLDEAHGAATEYYKTVLPGTYTTCFR